MNTLKDIPDPGPMLMSDNSLSLINHGGGKDKGVKCKVKSKHSNSNMSSKSTEMQLSE